MNSNFRSITRNLLNQKHHAIVLMKQPKFKLQQHRSLYIETCNIFNQNKKNEICTENKVPKYLTLKTVKFESINKTVDFIQKILRCLSNNHDKSMDTIKFKKDASLLQLKHLLYNHLNDPLIEKGRGRNSLKILAADENKLDTSIAHRLGVYGPSLRFMDELVDHDSGNFGEDSLIEKGRGGRGGKLTPIEKMNKNYIVADKNSIDDPLVEQKGGSREFKMSATGKIRSKINDNDDEYDNPLIEEGRETRELKFRKTNELVFHDSENYDENYLIEKDREIREGELTPNEKISKTTIAAYQNTIDDPLVEQKGGSREFKISTYIENKIVGKINALEDPLIEQKGESREFKMSETSEIKEKINNKDDEYDNPLIEEGRESRELKFRKGEFKMSTINEIKEKINKDDEYDNPLVEEGRETRELKLESEKNNNNSIVNNSLLLSM